ncbi:MAG: ImmA/IrrE family metallo-endopeptidase [Anaerolineales bacterium]|nr:ImmA/IrrE family metallo-endopeptidase [Anaerolineales bacterium]
MMTPKVIKSDTDHQAALAHLATLMNAAPSSPEGEELELFSILIEKYEEEHFPIDLPDPIEAIKFRMEQYGLTRKDLEQYIGSQSKVSEILNRKKPLSLAMIRSLHKGLEIPAEVLLQKPGKILRETQYNLRDYPFAEMYKRGYFRSFNGILQEAKQYAEELLEQLFSVLGDSKTQKVFCRNSDNQLDECALSAWQARVLDLASKHELQPYIHERFTLDFIRDIVKTSNFSTGPILAQELLEKRGIPLVVLPHLPQTYLDGACFRAPSGRPVVGMTLRHDRLDNFWFTLIHELAHIYLHLDTSDLAFFDDTEHSTHHSCNPQEIEANDLAADLLISNELWNEKKEDLLINNREARVIAFADQMGISPAIVAGRIRWETGDYTRFASLVGSKTVKKLLFSDN